MILIVFTKLKIYLLFVFILAFTFFFAANNIGASANEKFCTDDLTKAEENSSLHKEEQKLLVFLRKKNLCPRIENGDITLEQGEKVYFHMVFYCIICNGKKLDKDSKLIKSINLDKESLIEWEYFCKKTKENPHLVSNYYFEINFGKFCDFSKDINNPNLGGWFGFFLRRINDRHKKYMQSTAIELCEKVKTGKITTVEAFVKFDEIRKDDIWPTIVETTVILIKKFYTILLVLVKGIVVLVGLIATILGIAISIKKLKER
jgi:hypothetical protein